MKKTILNIFLFASANFLLVLFHLWIFKTPIPFAAWITTALHIIGLIMFPYKKLVSEGNARKSSMVLLAAFGILSLSSCNRVEPNYEGVLMQNYGRNGKADFKAVTGSQGILGPGSELYQTPMFEQRADPAKLDILTKNTGSFTVDPTYTYKAIRGKGVDIVFNFKHVGVTDKTTMMDNVEGSILNALVLNAYKEEARNFTTDSIMANMGIFESVVQARLKKEFDLKGFELLELTSGLLPPPSMRSAIEKMNNAKINAETLRNELEGERMKLEKAKIEQQANIVRAQGLDPRVLQEQFIEAIRNSNNKVIITDGRTPVILQQ